MLATISKTGHSWDRRAISNTKQEFNSDFWGKGGKAEKSNRPWNLGREKEFFGIFLGDILTAGV